MTHVKYDDDFSSTTLGNKGSSIPEPRPTPSSTPIPTIPNSLILIHNCQHAQASDARIRRLDDSIDLEVSTSAASTLVEKDTKETIPSVTHW